MHVNRRINNLNYNRMSRIQYYKWFAVYNYKRVIGNDEMEKCNSGEDKNYKTVIEQLQSKI